MTHYSSTVLYKKKQKTTWLSSWPTRKLNQTEKLVLQHLTFKELNKGRSREEANSIPFLHQPLATTSQLLVTHTQTCMQSRKIICSKIKTGVNPSSRPNWSAICRLRPEAVVNLPPADRPVSPLALGWRHTPVYLGWLEKPLPLFWDTFVETRPPENQKCIAFVRS
jgi:hypothetical protein